jgi:hypothetical protein
MLGGGSIDGKGYALGGRSAIPTTGIDNLDEYNPSADAWTARGPSPAPRCFIAACSSETRLHGFGGNHLTENQASAINATRRQGAQRLTRRDSIWYAGGRVCL